MSQRNRVVLDGPDYWHGSEAGVPMHHRRYGGIFKNAEGYSLHRMCDGWGGRGVARFKKFRHAKKALTKWINP